MINHTEGTRRVNILTKRVVFLGNGIYLVYSSVCVKFEQNIYMLHMRANDDVTVATVMSLDACENEVEKEKQKNETKKKRQSDTQQHRLSFISSLIFFIIVVDT
jgi:hypothetical protein